MVVFVPLVLIRDMEKLAWSHLLGNILVLTVIVVVMIYAGMNMAEKGIQSPPAFTS